MNYYERLGVSGTATTEEVQRAFRVRSFLLHPDHHQGAPPEVLEEANDEFRLLNEAFEVLKDPKRRASYDSALSNSRKPSDHPDGNQGGPFRVHRREVDEPLLGPPLPPARHGPLLPLLPRARRGRPPPAMHGPLPPARCYRHTLVGT